MIFSFLETDAKNEMDIFIEEVSAQIKSFKALCDDKLEVETDIKELERLISRYHAQKEEGFV